MIRLEVRCCCQPRKLFGTLPVEAGDWRAHRFEYMDPMAHIGDLPSEARVRSIELEPAMFKGKRGAPYLALKSGRYPIETFRKIPGFEEAKEPA